MLKLKELKAILQLAQDFNLKIIKLDNGAEFHFGDRVGSPFSGPAPRIEEHAEPSPEEMLLWSAPEIPEPVRE